MQNMGESVMSTAIIMNSIHFNYKMTLVQIKRTAIFYMAHRNQALNQAFKQVRELRIKTGCEFDDYWTNQEGWLVQDDGKLVCLDWDEYCTKCRVDDSKDCTFTVASNNNT